MKERAGASGHQDGGDICFFIQITGPFQKRGDRFLFPGDHFLHERIPDHEIGGGSVFIQKEDTASGLDPFHDPGSLGSAAAGILCRKTAGVFFVGKIVDKKRNIHVFDKTPVLGTEFQSGVVRDHILSSVPGNVVVNSQFQGVQEGGFAVVSAAHNEGDTAGDPHAGDFASMRKIQSDPERFRRPERHGILHGKRRDSAFSGKNRSVGHERRKGKLFQAAADIPLVFRKKNGLLQRGGAEISVIKRFFHTDGKKFKKDLFQFRRVDGAPVGRESDKKTGYDLFVRDLAGCPGENLLAAAADRDQAAFARTFCLESETVDLPRELPGEEVAEGSAGDGVFMIF